MTLATGLVSAFRGVFLGFVQLGLRRRRSGAVYPTSSAPGPWASMHGHGLRAVAAALTSPAIRFDCVADRLRALALVRLQALGQVSDSGLQCGELALAVASSLLARFCSSFAMAAARASGASGAAGGVLTGAQQQGNAARSR